MEFFKVFRVSNKGGPLAGPLPTFQPVLTAGTGLVPGTVVRVISICP